MTLAAHRWMFTAPGAPLQRAEFVAHAGAATVLRRALAIQEKVLSPEHPETVFVLANLGLVARAKGQLPAALDYLERALRVTEKSLGAEHINAASMHQNIGSILQQQGRYEQAEQELRRALQNLATIHSANREPAKGIPLLERALGARAGEVGARRGGWPG